MSIDLSSCSFDNNSIYSPIIDNSYNFDDINISNEIRVHSYDDVTDITSLNSILMDEIKMYAEKIQCSDFQGKGTIEDYKELFKVASKLANDTKQITLDVDIEGFNDLANAADELSSLFSDMTIKLQNINIIDDTCFLKSVANAMQKLYNLSEVFGKFKETILTTTTIQMPHSTHETQVAIEKVVSQINCAMKYIQYFVSPGEQVIPSAELSQEEKASIHNAIETIDSWSVICNHGVRIAMANNKDIQYMQETSHELKQTASILKKCVDELRTKLLI